MKTSAEMRWFFKDPLPVDVSEWFCGTRLCKVEDESHTDHYLVFTGSGDVGVKLRDGRKVEIKARLLGPEPFSLQGSRELGRLDAWVRWSDDDKTIADHFARLRFGNERWVSVVKDRRLRKFALPDGQLDEVDAGEWPERGVAVELTNITVNSESWWTMAFESFGDKPRPEDVRAVADHFLKRLPHSLTLNMHDSMSYPEWLNRLARGS